MGNISSRNWRPIHLNKGGSPLSHLFFSSDLILFVKARLHYIQVINECRHKFFYYAMG